MKRILLLSFLFVPSFALSMQKKDVSNDNCSSSSSNNDNNVVITSQLIEAACKNNPVLIQAALENGADIEQKDMFGRTALCWAAYRGAEKAVRWLIAAKANVNAIDRYDCLPIDYALWSSDPNIVEMLIEAGADVTRNGAHGNTPLHFAAEKGWTSIVKKLVSNPKCPIRKKNKKGLSAFQTALIERDLEIAQLLVAAGADIKEVNSEIGIAVYPLQEACGHQNVAMVQFLLSLGADVHQTDHAGFTPLHEAAKTTQDIVALLLLAGASPYRKDRYGTMPIQMAQKEIIAYINRWNVAITVDLFTAIKTGDIKTVKQLMQQIPLNIIVDDQGNSPLHIAVMHLFVDNQEQARSSSNNNNNNNSYPAASQNAKDMIALILMGNPQLITKKNNHGETPVDIAAVHNHGALALFTQLAAQKSKSKKAHCIVQ